MCCSEWCGSRMKKLLPYLLGLTVLLVGAIVSSRMLPKHAAESVCPKTRIPRHAVAARSG